MPSLNPTTIWIIALIVFLFIEIVTTGTLVSIWFCAGAFAAWLAALAGISFAVQSIIFVAVSVILLIALKPFVNRHIHKHIVSTNVDAVIGTHGIVTEEINNIAETGAVKADGKLWTARSVSEDVIIPEGSEVNILKIEGVKLIVSKI